LGKRRRFERLNATVRWTVACRQLDGGNTSIFALRQKCKRISGGSRSSKESKNPAGHFSIPPSACSADTPLYTRGALAGHTFYRFCVYNSVG
jgi:hypothetical protein